MANFLDALMSSYGHTEVPADGLIKYPHCSVCLHVKPLAGWHRSCKGPTKLRETEKPIRAVQEDICPST